MTRHYSLGRMVLTTLSLTAIIALGAPIVSGQTTYTFVNPTNDTSPIWDDPANWSPSTGYPSVAGDVAIFNRPPVSPSANFAVELPFAPVVTVGEILVNSAGFTSNHTFVLDVGPITFQSTSGSAKFTATAAGASGNSDRITVWNDITLNSDLLWTWDHKPNLNSSSFIQGLITANSTDRVITKEGIANPELISHGGAGFTGKYVVNAGGLRFLGNSNIAHSTGVTVNSGGQLQFNANASAATYDWNLATGASLKLNGNGKDPASSAPGGALRFQGQASQAATHSRFNSPVELQSVAEIAVGPVTVTGELTEPVTGAGGLRKSGPGTLILSDAASNYLGDTTMVEGILNLSNPVLNDDADFYFLANGTLNLNFAGTDVIDSLFIGGESQAEGLWGAIGNTAADFETDRITGTGLLQVTTFVSPVTPGDHNQDGVVDAADYVTWRKDPGSFGGDPNGYNDWVTNFGTSSAGGGQGTSAVPEPAACVSLLISVCFALVSRRRN